MYSLSVCSVEQFNSLGDDRRRKANRRRIMPRFLTDSCSCTEAFVEENSVAMISKVHWSLLNAVVPHCEQRLGGPRSRGFASFARFYALSRERRIVVELTG